MRSTIDWDSLIQQQEVSGKSAHAWCKEHHVNYNNFIYHRQRGLKTEISQGPFMELHEDVADPTWLEITMCGAKLILARKFNRSVLIRLLEILRKL